MYLLLYLVDFAAYHMTCSQGVIGWNYVLVLAHD